MSYETATNKICQFAFGVDHTTGPFFQIWELPADEQDSAACVVDNQGVDMRLPLGFLGERADGVERKLATLRQRFRVAKERGNSYPNMSWSDVNAVAIELGFGKDVEQRIVAVFD